MKKLYGIRLWEIICDIIFLIQAVDQFGQSLKIFHPVDECQTRITWLSANLLTRFYPHYTYGHC